MTSKTYSYSGRVHPSLPNVLDAYEAFCDYGSMRMSWRNLSLFLTHYLRDYFHFKDLILPPRKEGERPEFLARLPSSEFGYVVSDVVYLLLRQTPALRLDSEFVPWRFKQVNLNTGSSNGALLSLSVSKLHDLLLDVTIELDSRTDPRESTNLLSHLYSEWCPTQPRSDSPSLYTNELLPQEPRLTEFVQKSSLLQVGRNLLRRALSSGARPRLRYQNIDRTLIGRPVTLHHPVPVSGFDTSETTLVDSRPDSVVLPIYGEAISTPEEHTPQERVRPSMDKMPLPTLTEEDSESMHSSHTLESLLDLYGRASTSGSASASTESTQVAFPRDSLELIKSGWLKPIDAVGPAKVAFPRDSLDLIQSGRLNRKDTINPATSADDRTSSMSITSGYGSFVTAQSRLSVTVSDLHISSRPGSIATFLSITTATVEHPSLQYGAYQKMLQERDLLPERLVETNWSGRGQHVEYAVSERDDIPLQKELTLGRTRTALVESVRCRRVRIVRKTMRCTKWTRLKREDVVREVQHLYRVQHSHIVRLVGTYAIGSDVAILTYPCAEWNLEDFMRTAPIAEDVEARSKSLLQFFTCLSKVLDFMHSFPLKHMDIKPQNLLVRDIRHSSINESDPFKIYFTDFGISRSYPSVEECETETPISFTRAYAAMEVVLQESRGLPADIFSLGCVYAEMIATILDCSNKACLDPTQLSHREMLESTRRTTELGVRPYHSAIEEVRQWLAGLSIVEQPELKAVAGWTQQMLDPIPEKRPTARQVADDPHLPFACLSCTLRTGPEDFEVAEPLYADIHIP